MEINMIHVEVLEPRTVTMGRRETMIHLQGGMNMVDEDKWELLEKHRKGEIELAEKRNLIRVHKSKSGKISKKIITNCYLPDDLKAMRSKTKSAALLKAIDAQLELILGDLDSPKKSLKDELGL